MQRLSRAFRFINLSFRMALKHGALQKPWMYLSLGGIILTLLWLLPIGVLIRWLGSWPLAWVLVGAAIVFYLWSLMIWGELTALRTAQIFAALIQEGGGLPEDDPALAVFRAYGREILLYVLAVPGLNTEIAFQEWFAKPSPSQPAWKKAHPLIPPIIALKDLNLQGAIEALKAIVGENLLRFQPGYLPVAVVARGVAWIMVILGFIVGGFITVRIADPLFAASWRSLLAVSAGLGAVGVLSMAGMAFSTFSRACYHTALYAWALAVQEAHKVPGGAAAVPPEIISQAMSKNPIPGSGPDPVAGVKDKKEESDATET